MCKLKLTKMNAEIRIENYFHVIANVLPGGDMITYETVTLNELKQILVVAENFEMIFNSLK